MRVIVQIACTLHAVSHVVEFCVERFKKCTRECSNETRGFGTTLQYASQSGL